MFCKTAHCALVIMIALTCDKSREGMFVSQIAKQNNIPLSAFDGVVQTLEMCGFVTISERVLKLKIAPDDITIWQILRSVSGENLFQGDFYDDISWQHRLHPSSITTMLNKERDLILKIIEGRLCRYKLSKWSEKASKTIYI